MWKRQSVWSRAHKDWKGGHWLLRAVATPPLGFGAGYGVGYLLVARKMTSYPLWVPGLIGAVGAPVVWGLLTFLISLVMAPGKLLRESDVRIQKLERTRAVLRRKLINRALAAKYESQFGPKSSLPFGERFAIGVARFEELEAEVFAGDHSHSFEVLMLKDHLLGVLSKMMPEGTAEYRKWNARVYALAAAVFDHDVEAERMEQGEE